MSSSRAEQMQIFYEIAMAVGEGEDLRQVSRTGLQAILRKLNCSAGGIHLASEQQLQAGYTIPRSIASIAAYQAALQEVPLPVGGARYTEFLERLPRVGQVANGDSFHLLRLGDEGLLVIIRSAPLDRRLLHNLLPIVSKFALAIGYCLQRQRLTTMVKSLQSAEEELRSYQEQLEEKVAARTCELEQEMIERRKTEASLRRSEQRHRLFLETLPDPVVVYDAFGVVIFQNKAFSQSFGWKQGEHQLNSASFVPPDSREKTESLLQQLLKGQPLAEYETTRITKDGRTLQVAISAMPVKSPDGSRLPLVIVYRDVTEQRQLEHQLLHGQKMQAMGTLAGGIAHDFNNLLQAIQGYVQLLLFRQQKGTKEHKYLDAVDRATKRAAALVRQLLMASRKVESQLVPVDLNREILQVVKLLRHTLPKMIKIETRLSAEPLIINADSGQIEQVLLNLASNAQAAMPEGGTLEIATRLVVVDQIFCRSHAEIIPGDYALLEVSDNGCGMERSTLEHIFDPFFTTKGVGEGTGLGLSTAYGIIKNHQGHINCYSEPGQGTTFKVHLPQLSSMSQLPAIKPPAQPDLPGGNELILIADDESDVAVIARQMLEETGYRVEQVKSGEEALERYFSPERRVDLVLLDLGMPGMGGERCLKLLRERDPGARVLVASGYATREQEEKVLQLGARSFVAKPYELGILLGKVRAVLDAA